MTRFERAFAIVVGHEGGYVNNPADPGGETKWGISARSYPALHIASLTIEDARAIYLRDYWTRCRCDDLAGPLALIVFDAAVNNGVAQASRWLQIAVGVVPDGVVGPATIARALARNEVAAAADVHSRRILMMAALPTWQKFGAGWAKRLAMLPLQAGTFGC